MEQQDSKTIHGTFKRKMAIRALQRKLHNTLDDVSSYFPKKEQANAFLLMEFLRWMSTRLMEGMTLEETGIFMQMIILNLCETFGSRTRMCDIKPNNEWLKERKEANNDDEN